MKVLTVLGTRPEIIRLSRVMARLDATPGIDHVLAHTGQNYDYELNEVFFDDLGVCRPDHHMDVSRESLGAAYGDILAKTETVLREEALDAMLVLGDTNSAIAAIIAQRMHIPVFHMEAGNRSFDQNVPEEVNRRIVDRTADFNLVYTEHARRNLLAEGLSARHVYLTGSPMKEVLDHQADKIAASRALTELGLEPGGYFLVSAHREENVDHPDRLEQMVNTLRQLAAEYDKPVVVSLHPRTRNRIEALGIADGDGVRFQPPFGFSDYCRLQMDAACVLSDSGTISEESAILDFPAVSIRDSIERPEALDTGSIILCGLGYVSVKLDYVSVKAAVDVRLHEPKQSSRPFEYMIDDCSNRVVGLTGRSHFWANLH